jgi:hypothetical protein
MNILLVSRIAVRSARWQPTWAFEIPQNFTELNEELKAHYTFTPPDYSSNDFKQGEVYFFAINAMKSGQHEISFLEVISKIKEILGVSKKSDPLKFDDNKSVYPMSRAGQVVLLKDTILLVDGNHKTLAALALGSKTFPAEVVLDWRDKTLNQAASELERLKLTWPYLNGEKRSDFFSELTHLEDNPLRYWVTKAIGVVKTKVVEGRLKILSKKRIKHPLAVKINRDQAYWEWIVALALESQNFTHFKGEEHNPMKASILEARRLIKLALESDFIEKDRLQKIFMIEDSELYQRNQNLLKAIEAFLAHKDCRNLVP